MAKPNAKILMQKSDQLFLAFSYRDVVEHICLRIHFFHLKFAATTYSKKRKEEKSARLEKKKKVFFSTILRIRIYLLLLQRYDKSYIFLPSKKVQTQ